jgi:phosphoribosylformimino-5-aminoimidazole carboxamide ribotide isomerase
MAVTGLGTMQIWPAIDLRGGKCVRLEQGDYQRETVFGDDPASMARHWVAAGGQFLHLVDLDGARTGRVENRSQVQAILAAVTIPCELGGGIRDAETIADLLDMGLERLVIGTKALREPDWFRQVCRRFPHRLVLGIDARDGRVASDGWLEASDVRATDLAREMAREPIAALIYTDIATDGMFTGPNLKALRELSLAIPQVGIIASGGVATLEHVQSLHALGPAIDGVIIGKAFYDGKLSLSEVLRADA